MPEESVTDPRRGADDKTEVLKPGVVRKPPPHEHKFTTSIVNPNDPPFRKVCEICAHGETIDESDPTFGDQVKKARA